MTNPIERIQQNLGYGFRDVTLLETALTPRSSTNGACDNGDRNNERLEFLGDAWLDALIGEELYRRFPDTPEGKLTKTRADLVCERSLAEMARKLEIGPALFLSPGEERTGAFVFKIRNKSSIALSIVKRIIIS